VDDIYVRNPSHDKAVKFGKANSGLEFTGIEQPGHNENRNLKFDEI
jgi:hypothetical protein